MYTRQRILKTSLKVNQGYKGETIEQKCNRIVNNKEPITDGAPIIYTERREGVIPGHDIRTDRWEVAIDALDKVTKSHIAKREQRIGEKTYDTMTDDQKKEFHTKFPNNKYKPKDGGPEPTQTTK